MSKHIQKWLIDFDDGLDATQKQELWGHQHMSGYVENVWSVTQDRAIRAKLILKIEGLYQFSRILIPGCGSEVHLQNDLARRLPNVERIICTDYTDVVDLAREKESNPLVTYESRDSTNLGWEGYWDVVVPVNSVLSASDTENRQILRSCYTSLRPGGALVGYFPTIFAAFDIQSIDPSILPGSIDVHKCLFYEESQQMYQIFYTSSIKTNSQGGRLPIEFYGNCFL
jgi:SAM-dependent methyltransferase